MDLLYHDLLGVRLHGCVFHAVNFDDLHAVYFCGLQDPSKLPEPLADPRLGHLRQILHHALFPAGFPPPLLLLPCLLKLQAHLEELPAPDQRVRVQQAVDEGESRDLQLQGCQEPNLTHRPGAHPAVVLCQNQGKPAPSTGSGV